MIPRSFAIAASSACIGFGVGYIVAQKRLVSQFEERLEKETAGMREFYQTVKKPFATPQEAAAALINEEESEEESTAEKIGNKVAYHKIVKANYSPEENPEEQHEIETDVFSAPDGTLMVGELKHHNVFKEEPIIISQEEFMQNDSEYVQTSLTYYKLDKVLTDDRENVLEDSDNVVGIKNMEMFGDPKSGSSDSNVIHIRNGRLQMEFEVCQSENSYRREVLGIDEDPPRRPSGRDR